MRTCHYSIPVVVVLLAYYLLLYFCRGEPWLLYLVYFPIGGLLHRGRKTSTGEGGGIAEVNGRSQYVTWIRSELGFQTTTAFRVHFVYIVSQSIKI